MSLERAKRARKCFAGGMGECLPSAPAETAVCTFVANNLHKGGNRGSWKPLQHGWKKREKKEPRRVGDPPLSFGEFIRAHPQGCFVCYGRNSPFQHDHGTCPTHKADTEAYKKAHGSKKRAPTHVREAKVEVSKDELSKLMMIGNELAKEIQEIKRAWARYFSVNYPDFSPRFTLSWRSPPSRPHCTAHLPYKARCIIKQYL